MRGITVRHAIRSPVLEEVLVQYVVVDDAVQFVRARRVMMGSRYGLQQVTVLQREHDKRKIKRCEE